jgi:hypothetical protein
VSLEVDIAEIRKGLFKPATPEQISNRVVDELNRKFPEGTRVVSPDEKSKGWVVTSNPEEIVILWRNRLTLQTSTEWYYLDIENNREDLKSFQVIG